MKIEDVTLEFIFTDHIACNDRYPKKAGLLLNGGPSLERTFAGIFACLVRIKMWATAEKE